MCDLCKKLEKLEIDEAYSLMQEEGKNIAKEHKEKIYEDLVERYYTEVLQYLPWSD